MRNLVYSLSLLIMILGTGCQPGPMDAGIPSEQYPRPMVTFLPAEQTPVLVTPDRIDRVMTKTPDRVPPSEAFSPINGEVPAKLLESILNDLSARSGIPLEKIRVIQAESIVWNDGSLGCPQPGMMYTLSLVDGYRVILSAGDQEYDYHAAQTGYFFLCEH